MKIRSIFVAVALSLTAPLASASGLLGDAPETGSVGNIDFGFVNTSGNTDTSSLNGQFDYVTRMSKEWAMGFTLKGLNNSTDGIRSSEKYGFEWNNRYDLSSDSFLYGTFDYTDDYFGAYDYQSGLYLGYGMQLIKNDDHDLSIGVAAGYRVNANFIGEDDKEGVLRGDLDYSHNISESAKFTQKLVVIVGEEVDTYTSESALSTKISDSLSLKLAYSVNHNSVVPVGRDKTDTVTSIGVSYSF